MKKGMIVAITGQTGSGKSTLSKFYASKGLPVIDCDEVAKHIRTFPGCQQQLAEHFGMEVLTQGKINTGILYERAFKDEESLQRLTDITHPFIVKEILRRADEAFEKGEEIVFVDGAVIIGHSFEEYCDKFIVVVAHVNTQCERLMKRDSITYEQAKARIMKQTPYSDMLKKADYVINNNKSIMNLISQGEFVIRQLIDVQEVLL